ncbi:FAD-dependent oxidoreductase [Solemya velum gill symbiont]|uniref:FAD-dependent oxidoreductase n=1 Tax=Solemya velum gill symbiont TaxID=2340 RepID=UPI002DDD2247|nr:FAD-dependent oxidoreductase [Solemya velum gill symbiont]
MQTGPLAGGRSVIKNEEDLFLANVELFKERFRIDARINSEVTDVDPDSKTVTVRNLESGESYSEEYDELVLAPGARPVRPPLPGIDVDGIFSLRSVPDSNQIKQWIHDRNVKRAVIIGGGFIGIEMVENLVELGIHTTLVERNPQILPPLDPEMTVPLRTALHQHGVAVYLGESVNGFERAGELTTVKTESGKSFQAELVILAIGVMPENELAKSAGLTLGPRGHIIVDKNLRTSDSHIYAIGDCIEVKNIVSGSKIALALAGPANRQGRIVADMLAGRGRFFRGVQGTAVCGLFNQTAAMTGLNEKSLKEQVRIEYSVVYAHPTNHVGYYPGAAPIQFKLIYDKSDGRVLGAQAVGEAGVERRIDVISMAIQMHATVFDLEESELCYAPQYGAAKDPVNVIGMIAANEMRGDLSITHWNKMGSGGAVVLDVRDANEVAAHALPIAVHIPLNDIRDRQDELPKDSEIHVSCAVGSRAYNAVRLLRNLGFQANLLSGGEKTFEHLRSCASDDAVSMEHKDRMDFLLSWEVMRDTLTGENEDVEQVLAILKNPKVFYRLPLGNIVKAIRRMESVDVKSGEAVMNQGDTGDFFYIIRKGTAEVWQQGLYDNEQKLVAKLETGDHFGEEALVTGGARNASVKMTSNGNLLRLNREDFQELITQQTIEEVDIDKAHQLLSQGCKMLDVRYQEEYEESHVPGVQLIPLPELRNRLDELEPDTQYIASCLSGKRSAVAAMILKQHGFNVLVLEHGLRDWPYEMVSEF